MKVSLTRVKKAKEINGEPYKFYLDTGTETIAVPQNFVKKSKYTGGGIGNWRYESIKMAEMKLEVKGKTQPWKFVVQMDWVEKLYLEFITQ